VTDVTLGTLRIFSSGVNENWPLLDLLRCSSGYYRLPDCQSAIISAYLAYAAGFAAGASRNVYRDRLALQVILAIVQNNSERLTTHLHAAGYGVTCVDGEGANGSVKLIYTVFPRRNLEDVISIIHTTHPNAFLSIQDVSSTQAGIFPLATSSQYGLFSARNLN
jgi:hypothetical protein